MTILLLMKKLNLKGLMNLFKIIQPVKEEFAIETLAV